VKLTEINGKQVKMRRRLCASKPRQGGRAAGLAIFCHAESKKIFFCLNLPFWNGWRHG
jgi:hypothetical protein